MKKLAKNPNKTQVLFSTLIGKQNNLPTRRDSSKSKTASASMTTNERPSISPNITSNTIPFNKGHKPSLDRMSLTSKNSSVKPPTPQRNLLQSAKSEKIIYKDIFF